MSLRDGIFPSTRSGANEFHGVTPFRPVSTERPGCMELWSLTNGILPHFTPVALGS